MNLIQWLDTTEVRREDDLMTNKTRLLNKPGLVLFFKFKSNLCFQLEIKSDNTKLLVQQATPFALLTNISWVKIYYKYEAKNKLRADEELVQKSETLFGFQKNAKENIHRKTRIHTSIYTIHHKVKIVWVTMCIVGLETERHQAASV